MTSQQFLSRFSNVFFGFAVLLCILIADFEFLTLYLINPTTEAFYYAYLALLCLSAIFGAKSYRDYLGFRETLAQGLFCSSSSDVDSFGFEPLEIPADKALAVCTYYHNGATFNQIAESIGLKEAQQVKRLLVKGLEILLKEHNERVKT